jgi:hypothetical protein
VQGFSSVIRNADGSYLGLVDNGYGSKANSADFLLRLYHLNVDFKTASGGTGGVGVGGFLQLRDPDRKLSFEIVADRETYYPGSAVAVDPAIRAERLLTGADLDVESFRRAADGTFWIGDEFGPFLIHVDATGKVLEEQRSLPNFNGFGSNPLVQSPDNPLLGSAAFNLNRSRGFEGMALSHDGSRLFTLLEGALTTDPDPSRLLINEFDLAGKRYTGSQFFYKLASNGHAIGEMTAVNENEYLVIERDNNQGAAAAFKKIFLVDFGQKDADGFVKKTELVDLLALDDPDNLGGLGTGKFTFPFVTIESVWVIDENTIGVANDNNFPFSAGRTPGKPDNNEFITIGLNRPLRFAAIPEPGTLALAAVPGLLLAGGTARGRRRRR